MPLPKVKVPAESSQQGSIVGLARSAHCIAGSGEVLSAVLSHSVTTLGYGRWLALAASSNIVGGVLFVTLLEYGQSKLD
jgi:formate/nitrite transporter FocA (FNT family)